MHTAQQKTYYDILGVPETASQDDIRKAYRKLAHRYHPDKTGGDKEAEAKLKEINEAYDTLKNKEKRAKYDAFRKQGGFAGFGSGHEGFQGFAGGAPGFDDIFETFFGGGGRATARGGPLPGADIEAALRISLRDAYQGGQRTIRVPRQERCTDCGGGGVRGGGAARACAECNGAGRVRHAQGFFSMSATCPRCGGAGRIIDDPCPGCGGAGLRAVERDIRIDIPRGIPSGVRLRLAGQGGAGAQGGPRGDLYVYIEVQPDPLFTRSGDDIVLEVPVTMTQAALGAKIRVPTIDGAAELAVPEGAQHGAQLRMRGLGMPRMRGAGRGDQIVRLLVEVPVNLSEAQKKLLREWDAGAGPSNYRRREGFLERLKQYAAQWSAGGLVFLLAFAAIGCIAR